jgi:hypothetical protein
MNIKETNKYSMTETSAINCEGEEIYAPVLIENSKALPFLKIQPKFKIQFLGYIQIFYDLEFVKQCLSYLSKIYDKNEYDFLKQTIWESLIIKYGKCFARADGRKIKLEPKVVFKDHPSFLEIHNEIIDLRHQHIAHAGNSKNELIDAYFALHHDKNKPPVGIYHQIKRAFSADLENIKKYYPVVDSLSKYVYTKIFKLQITYQKKLLETDSIDDLYKKSFKINREQT